MKSPLLSSIILSAALIFSVAAGDFAEKKQPLQAVVSGMAPSGVPRDEIFSSFLGKFVRLSEMPPGIYAWQLDVPLSDTLEAALSAFSSPRAADEPEAEDFYKGLKFEDGNKPWIKFLVKSDRSLVFTSRGLIVKQSEQIQDLENYSSFILTRIKNDKGIKFSDKLDESTRNVYSAIYNAIKCRMKLSCREPLDTGGRKISAMAVEIRGTAIGHYFESELPGYYSEVRYAFTIKSSGQIARVFVNQSKKNFYSTAKASSPEFLERFSGLLPSDITCDNEQLVTPEERRNGLSSRRLEFIGVLSSAVLAARSRLESAAPKEQN